MKSYFFITKDPSILDRSTDTYKRHKLYFKKDKDIQCYLVILKKKNIKNYNSMNAISDLNISEVIFGYFNFFKRIIFKKNVYKIINQDIGLVLLPMLILKIFKNFKILAQIHGELYSISWIFMNFKNPIKFIYTNILIFFIDEIRVVNNKTKKIIKRLFVNKKIYNIPVPIIHKFSKSNSNNNFTNIIFITEFIKIKNYQGIDVLLDKINKSDLNIKNINIFGDGKYFLSFKKFILNKKYKFNVNFHGFKNLNIIEKYLKNSFFFINISRSESYSRTIVESFNCDLPVLSFKSTGPNELVQAECLVKFAEYDLIINKLSYYSKNKDKYLKIKEQVRDFKNSYYPMKLIKNWTKLIYQ